MMNAISKLSNIQNASANSLRFNGTLPINIKVLEKQGFGRYKLKLGNRDFTTKSQKDLEVGSMYWGNFGEGKDGIITISNLYKKPDFLQNDSDFLDIEMSDFLTQLKDVNSPISTIKEWLLENLGKKETSKNEFKIYAKMLFALKKGVIFLPLKHNGIGNIIQIKPQYGFSEFYCCFDNLGVMRGFFKEEIERIDVLFNKTLYFLKKANIANSIHINKNIEPLFEDDNLMLNLKG